MDQQALASLLASLETPTDIKHITPSAALIDVLKREAMALDLVGMVETCEACKVLLPSKYDFVQQKLPGLLANYYLIMREDLDQAKAGLRLSEQTDWMADAVAAMDNADALQAVMDTLVEMLNR